MIPDWLRALLSSRKFWLTLITAISTFVMYLQGLIPAEKLVEAIVALVIVLMGSIAIEDAAAKSAVAAIASSAAQIEADTAEIEAATAQVNATAAEIESFTYRGGSGAG